jgi:hypothetical protein
MPMTKSQFSAAYLLSAVIVILIAVASAGGLFVTDLYRDNVWASSQFRGSDLVRLVVVVPIFIVALFFAVRGSRRAQLIWLGLLWLTVYDYAFYLFGAAFNRLYAAASGRMVGRDHKPTTRGHGWSATDLGRLLVWLKIVSTHDPEHEALARRIVARLDLDRIVRDGYLRGEELTARGRRRLFQEGRIGYEQYAAAGFALWGIRAEGALDLNANATPVTVLGQSVLADRRGDDLLTSEPVVMLGLELGWPSADWERLARAILAAQEERHRRTGLVTIVSEDAVPRPPAYFYYYLLHHNGEDFVVVTPSHDLVPWNLRWVSAKAAFAWHALFPSAYTWLALQTIKGAESPNVGWSAGVYERSRVKVQSNNLNTAAVILESAAYFVRGCPLIIRSAGCPSASSAGAGGQGVPP